MRDEGGSPLISQSAVEASIKRIQGVFDQQAKVKVIPSGDDFIKTLDYAAPTAALNVRCRSGAWKEDLGEAGDYFGLNIEVNPPLGLTGYAAPVIAFIVRNVAGKGGCSLGPLTDYVTIDLNGIKGDRTLAHEVGHACGLLHWWGKGTLMEPGATWDLLKRWQKAILRNSRHVTYL